MKKLLFLFIWSSVHQLSRGQIAVNTTNASPHNSAMLDISSENKGLLIPRLTKAQKDGIASPATGLLVYQTDTIRGFYYYTGNGWINLSAAQLDPQTGNVFIGLRAGQNNTTGYNNIAIGTDALKMNTVRNHLVAIGDSALMNNLGEGFTGTAARNTAIGFKVLAANTTGSGNTAMGHESLLEGTTGSDNTAVGVYTLRNLTSGGANTVLGYQAMGFSLSGNWNTAVGHGALRSNHTNFNTAVGYNSLNSTDNSQFNTAIGVGAGANRNNGWNNTFLGSQCDANANDLFNCLAVGQAVTNTASSQARIGNSATSSIGGFANWSNISDVRFKKNIRENVRGLEFILKLRPVTYSLDVTSVSHQLNEMRGRERWDEGMKTAFAQKEKMVFSGFIAQEVETAASELGYDFSGVDKPKNEKDFYGLRYAEFVVPLVKAVQEQQVLIEELRHQNSEQKKKNETLQARLQKLERMMDNKK